MDRSLTEYRNLHKIFSLSLFSPLTVSFFYLSLSLSLSLSLPLSLSLSLSLSLYFPPLTAYLWAFSSLFLYRLNKCREMRQRIPRTLNSKSAKQNICRFTLLESYLFIYLSDNIIFIYLYCSLLEKSYAYI